MSGSARPRRAWLVLYLLGFGCLVVAGALIGYAAAVDFLADLGWLWASIVASVIAAALAVAGLVAARRD